MKKFAFGILSVFMILGGVLLSACGTEVSLSVSTQEVVIYTNYKQGNYQQKEIEVSLENSNAGITTQILSGADCIELENTNTAKAKANGKYAFKILTKENKKSGTAKVLVSAVEDLSKSKEINVRVNTILENIYNVDAKSNMYVVKGVEKELDENSCFQLFPVTANVCDIDWVFDVNGTKTYEVDGEVLATIKNENGVSKLLVESDFKSDKIVLRAMFVKNTSVCNTVTLEVLENSTIKDLVVEGNEFYSNSAIKLTAATLGLKRNNANSSVAEGVITVNTPYDIDLGIVAYTLKPNGDKNFLDYEEYSDYIHFDILSDREGTSVNSHTYQFCFDAYDYNDNALNGNIYVYFAVCYKDFSYRIETKDLEICLSTSYAATKIDLLNEENNSINNSSIEVFSNYSTSNGYVLKSVVQPEDRAVDNSNFRFVIDLNQQAFIGKTLDTENPIGNVVKVLYRNKYLTFVREGSNYVSEALQSGSEVYLTACGTYENVVMAVQSLSDMNVSTNLYLYLYQISDDEDLKLTKIDGSELEKVTFISSSISSEKSVTFDVKITGIASISGLSLSTNASSRFEFSELEVLDAYDSNDPQEKYVAVRFGVNLTSYNFSEKATFVFQHLTGKESETFEIQAFVPIEYASIQNADTSSADVYIDRLAPMDYVLKEGKIEKSSFVNSSLSKLMVEVGSTLNLHTELRNATLAESGIVYKYISYEALEEILLHVGYGYLEVEGIFDNAEFDEIISLYDYYVEVDTEEVVITPEQLVVPDNGSTLKGIVAVEINGFDENHDEVVFVRFFTFESLYSVRYLSSNVKTKLLYTSETLSLSDMALSYVDVTVELRPDKKVPTYSNDFSRLSFVSATGEWASGSSVDTYLKNDFYTVSAVSFDNSGAQIRFRITANSTNLQTSVNDILTVRYTDGNGVERKTEITLEIKNVKRIESVKWLNETSDGEIYLNLTSSTQKEKNFTISTSVLPNDANDIGLTYKYFATSGSTSDLKISTSAIGQTFNVNINTSVGGYGYMYLVPTDMIKIVDGTERILLYSYTEEDGVLKETPYYEIKLSNLNARYNDIINGLETVDGVKDFENYFLNNDGKKVYYKDILLRILVRIADGRSQETAIRLYNQGDLESIDTALYYDIMNDISFSNWKTITTFSGGMNGKGHTFKFVEDKNNQTFIGNLSGKISDITFVGQVYSTNPTQSGFIADYVQKSARLTGTIENCTIDVYSVGIGSSYVPSKLLSGSPRYVGLVAGKNEGLISNVKVFGASITTSSYFAGGIVGVNSGRIEDCGYELYDFEDGKFTNVNLGSSSDSSFGGIVGYTLEGSLVERSYVYDFCNEGHITSGNVFALAGDVGGTSTFNECFAYLNNLKEDDVVLEYSEKLFKLANSAVVASVTNCYMTYMEDSKMVCAVFVSNGNKSKLDSSSNVSDLGLDGSIWRLENLDANVNFGFVYLQNVLPSVYVDINNLNVSNTEGKSVFVDEYSGVLFVYAPIQTITDKQEKSVLEAYNTISVKDLFGLESDEQARSVLLTSNNTNIMISSNSVRILSETFTEFEVVAHLKMDYSQTKTFKFVIVNALPTLNLLLNGIELKDGQTLLLQTNKTKNVVFNLESKISLNGSGEFYALQKDNYEIVPPEGDEYVGVSKSGNTVFVTGKKAHTEAGIDSSRVTSNVVVCDLFKESENEAERTKYQNALRIEKDIDVSVYSGTTGFAIRNANNLTVKPAQYATFEVYMTSDNVDDGLDFGLKYGDVEIAENKDGNLSTFDVDGKLVLEVSWTKIQLEPLGNNQYKFNVVIKISQENLHLIDENYDNFVLSVNSQSQIDSDEYIKYIDLSVETQEINDITATIYKIESRQIRNSTLHYNRSNSILNAIAPSSDAIVTVTIDPVFAKATHFTLTYSSSGEGQYGTVSIVKLAKNSNFGYYADSSSSYAIENGLRVDLIESYKKGDGVFNFRTYISSAFSGEVNLKFTVTVYDGENVLLSGSHEIKVSALNEATVTVGGVTTYLLAKGETATVEVAVGLGQTLYNLYLENNGANIILTKNSKPELRGAYNIYTATIYAGVDATLADGADSGIFYVWASVERVLNGVQEIKSTSAMICLVDFAVDTSATKVGGSSKQEIYNGKSYDVFTSYINENPKELYFDYVFVPETYNYDKTNAAEIQKVNEILEKRNSFVNNNYYGNEEAGYYINYKYNENSGRYDEALSLKQQLWVASDESHITNLYNSKSGAFNTNTYFNISSRDDSVLISGKQSGTQLMMLRTTIVCQGVEFVRDYFFLIKVEIYTDEESPAVIKTAEKFKEIETYEEADDYILMNDIVLENYDPISTKNFNSLDGNGYTIHINSFALPDDTSLKLALFDTITNNSTIKNVKVNIYNGGQIFVNINQYKEIVVAGFAVKNSGIVYNCEVVSYYDADYQASRISGDTGLVVKYTKGTNTDPIQMSSLSGVESYVSGFIYENDADSSISNCRVGGEETWHITKLLESYYRETIKLNTFVIEGQGEVAGFANQNSGYISASYAKNIQVYNKMKSTTSITAGFVVYNNGKVQNDYVEGLGGALDENGDPLPYNNLSNISSMGIVAGFVYANTNLVKNSYANIAVDSTETKSTTASGFVYINSEDGVVELCYSAVDVAKDDIGQMQFSGVDGSANSLNAGKIILSYYYKESRLDNDVNESKYKNTAVGVSDVFDTDTFYGFSFASSDGSYDGIWEMSTNGISLVSANQIALTNRYDKTISGTEYVFYNESLRDIDTLEIIDVRYGSVNNPIIIRDASDFAKATGKATPKENSSYKVFYTDSEVLGNYRFVRNVDMSQIAQNSDENKNVKLTTTTKIFRGLLDGNGFTVSNISLGSSTYVENYGLFAKLDKAVIMNLDLTVESVHNREANIVGTFAGTALDSRILAVTLSPVENGDSEASQHTAIQGGNIVGGVVGMIFGNSYLCDVNVSNIDVESFYYLETKNIDTNSTYTSRLRELLNINISNSIQNTVARLSYAGGIAGYIDMYRSELVEYAKFSSSLTEKDYNVVSVGANGTVNIYGEVAGGLFGYIGTSTYVYDAKLSLSNDLSYIISKNLYAGGIVGENYGALHAVSASYVTDIQEAIEESEHDYYNGTMSVERGQQSIFSYGSSDAGSTEKINNPMFIGGIAGYMGGGFVYVAYNKLNVVSEKPGTIAAGGIVGLLAKNLQFYSLDFLSTQKSTNYLFYEVYASGDTYSKYGSSGGIIGSIERKNGSTSDIALNEVMAVNYYSLNASNQPILAGEASEVEIEPSIESSYTSSNYFALIGKIGEKTATGYETGNYALSSNIYTIDTLDNISCNLKTGELHSESGSPTVGGYLNIVTSSGTVKLNPFGFETKSEEVKKSLIDADHIGSADLNKMSYAYSRMYSYFIGKGWREKFWNHKQDCLFPEIELVQKLEILFWDDYNKEEILEQMNNSSVTVVVRGRLTSSNDDQRCVDIDLTDVDYEEINFRGKLYSYTKYMNTLEGGRLTETKTNASGNVIGGQVNEGAGIILKQTLFDKISGSALIDGVTFYVNSENFDGVAYAVEESIIRNVDIVVNPTSLTLNAKKNGTSSTVSASGLLANVATSSSILNIDVRFRKDTDDENPNNEIIIKVAGDDEKVYAGFVVGYFRQESRFTNIVLQKVSIKTLSGKDANLTMSVKSADSVSNDGSDVYAGITTGYVGRSIDGTAKVEISLLQFESTIKISFDNTFRDVYVGGYVGKVDSVNSLVFEKAENLSTENSVEIVQNANLRSLIAGAFFGGIDSAISLSGANVNVKTKISQNSSVSLVNANVGGLVGLAEQSLILTGFNVEGLLNEEVKELIIVSTQTGNDEDGIGGLIGLAKDSLTITNCSSMTGKIETSVKYVGGLVGRTEDELVVNGSTDNDIDIDISGKSDNTEYFVGGLAGIAVGNKVHIQEAVSYYTYNGTVETSGVKKLNFGGAFGSLCVTDADVLNCIFGGKLIVNAVEAGILNVGGIVGFIGDGKKENADSASVLNCFAYGDIFVEYDSLSMKLGKYSFGGIVGFADGENEKDSVSISTCVSLLTNFNSRSVVLDDLSALNSNIGAIVGQKSLNVGYSKNAYSSGVCLAYQEETGCFDYAYNDLDNNVYYGYSAIEGVTRLESTSEGILKKIFGVNIADLSSGEKLKPIAYTSGALKTDKWYCLNVDIEIDKMLDSSSTEGNIWFIGNGHKITRNTDSSVDGSKTGGLFNVFGKRSIVSNLTISCDIEEDPSNRGTYYGVVAGNLKNNAVIYAVGVNGSVSVGGSCVNLGGLVGTMNGGYITDSYFDGELYYRGSETANGITAGLVGVIADGCSTISASYSSGMITPYSKCEAKQICSISSITDTTQQKIILIDDYSIIQLDKSKCVCGEQSGEFLLYTAVATGSTNVVTKHVEREQSPIPYKENESTGDEQEAEAENSDVYSWYSDLNVNYGYKAHGFGFLRNAQIKVFERVADTSLSNLSEDGKYIYTIYSYTKVDVGELKSKIVTKAELFNEVLNKEKFIQMLDAEIGNYFLRYDIDIGDLEKSAVTAGTNDVAFKLDGQQKVLSNYGQTKSKNAGLFGLVQGKSEIINLRMTNSKMAVDNVGSRIGAGLLVSNLYGKVCNVVVEGEITIGSSDNTQGVGGIVGHNGNGGSISVADSKVNITNNSSKNTGAIGGVVGHASGGTVSYCTNSGILDNNGSGDRSISGAYLREFSAITGGIVGYTSAGKVEYCYNSNSVLTAYTNTTMNKSVSGGGIVGASNGGTISNCVNAGLVGSGNYSITGNMVFAGGIVGYNNPALHGIEVNNCVNDGAVQALGKADGDSKIETSASALGSDSQIFSLTNNPENLVLDVKMTYNPGDTREVYASGIGWGIDGSSNSTSVDNIKNDGNVGEIVDTQKIVFDRYAVLNNDDKFVTEAGQIVRSGKNGCNEKDGDYSFWATYALQTFDGKSYKVSGFDSYGYISRVYAVDQINRQYGNGENDMSKTIYDKPLGTDLFWNEAFRVYAVRQGDAINSKFFSDLNLQGIDGTLVNDWFLTKTGGQDEVDAIKGQVGSWYEFEKSSTQYSSSTTFKGYESILKDVNSASCEGTANDISSIFAEDKIIKIMKAFESKQVMDINTINTKQVAFVNNETQLNASIAPITVDVKAVFDLPEDCNDLSFELQETNNPTSPKWAFFLPNKYDEESKSISYKVYYSNNDDVQTSFKVVAAYSLKKETSPISLENVTIAESKQSATIKLCDENSESLLSQNIVNAINSESLNDKTIGSTIYNSYSLSIVDSEGNELDTFASAKKSLSYDSTNGYAVLTLSNLSDLTKDIFDGKTLKIILNVSEINSEIVAVTYKSTTNNWSCENVASLLDGQLENNVPAVSDGKRVSGSEFASCYSGSQVNLDMVLSKANELKGGTVNTLVMGSNDANGNTLYSVAYQNGLWSVKTGELTIEGNKLRVPNEVFNGWTVYYDATPSDDGIGGSYTTTSDDGVFALEFTNLISVGDPVVEDDESSKVSKFGVEFVGKKFTYTVDSSSANVAIKSLIDIGYIISVNRDGGDNTRLAGSAKVGDVIYSNSLSLTPNISIDYTTTVSDEDLVGSGFAIFVKETSGFDRRKTYYIYNEETKKLESVAESNKNDIDKYYVKEDDSSINVSSGKFNTTDTSSEVLSDLNGKFYTMTTYLKGESGYSYQLFENGSVILTEMKIKDGAINSTAYAMIYSETNKVFESYQIVNSEGKQSFVKDESLDKSYFYNENIKVIATVKNDRLYFIRNNCGILVANNVNKTTYTPNTLINELNMYCQSSKYTDTTDNAESIEVSSDYSEILEVSGKTITSKVYGKMAYEYTANCKQEQQITVSNKESKGKPVNIVVLNSDIFTTITARKMSMPLFGMGHTIKFVGKEALFTNLNEIRDIKIVGAISLSSYNFIDSIFSIWGKDENGDKVEALFLKGNVSNLSNIEVYGSIRNVNHKNKVTVNPVSTVSLGDEYGKSFVTVNVLDASLSDDNEKSVQVKIEEKNNNGKNILISGDGASSVKNYWKNGSDGGNGGSIRLIANSNSFARAGVAGKAGNGSDSSNGGWDGSKVTKAIDPGKAGTNGSSGTVTKGSSSLSSNTRDFNAVLHSGNKGIDGLGRIYAGSNNKYYLAGEEGAQWLHTQSGDNGYKIFGKIVNDGWKNSLSSRYYEIDWWNGYKKVADWKNDFNNGMRSPSIDIKSLDENNPPKVFIVYDEKVNWWDSGCGHWTYGTMFSTTEYINQVASFTAAKTS